MNNVNKRNNVNERKKNVLVCKQANLKKLSHSIYCTVSYFVSYFGNEQNYLSFEDRKTPKR